jgi:hypothetical protein
MISFITRKRKEEGRRKKEEGRRKIEQARLLLFSRAVSFSPVLRLLAVMLYPGIHPTPLKIQDNSQIYGNFA